MTSRSNLLEAATFLKSLGWPVFPLMPRAKTPVTKRGVLDHTRFDEQIVEAWWNQNPTCNIGLATGVTFEVVDIDGEPGEEALERVLPGYTHTGPEVDTGRGRHLYFASQGLRNTANPTLKVDFRGHHGYVVAPPSVHPDGHAYRWSTPPTAALPKLPEEIRIAIGANKHREPDPHELAKGWAMSRGLDLRDLLTQIYGPRRWYRMGDLYRTICPIGVHSDSDPSFTVYPDNHYHCFGCGAHGWAHELKIPAREEGATE